MSPPGPLPCPTLPCLQHSRQCLFFVPDTLEIFVCDESLDFPLPFWKLGAFKRRALVERKNMRVPVPGGRERGDGTCSPRQLELGPFGQLECG